MVPPHRPELERLLDRVLEAAMSATRADFGNVQLVDPASGALLIAAHTGFKSEFLEYFAIVDGASSACGRAAREHSQIIIYDVTTDPGFASHRDIAAATGFRAVQSTPLTDQAGRLVGMVSTHFRRPHRPPARELRLVELYADLAGEAVTRRLSPATAAEDTEADPAGSVVHRLISAGLSLASAQSIIAHGPAADRVAAAVDELDLAVRELRMLVYRTRQHPA